MLCVNCGYELCDDAKFCVSCGHRRMTVNKVSYVVTSVEENENNEEIKTQMQLNDVGKTAESVNFTHQENTSVSIGEEKHEIQEQVNTVIKEDAENCKYANKDSTVSDEFRYNENEWVQRDSVEEKTEREQDKEDVSFVAMSLSAIINNVKNKFRTVFQKGLNIKVVFSVICIALVAVFFVSGISASPEKLIVGTWIEQADDYSQAERIIFYKNGSCIIDGFSASYSLSDNFLTVSAYLASETYEINISRNKMELLEVGDFPGEETVYKREDTASGVSITKILVVGGCIALFVFVGYVFLKKQKQNTKVYFE